MHTDSTEAPEIIVRDILANGPLPPAEFRRLAHERGIPVKNIGKAAKAAGAECRRIGPPGKDGWLWMLSAPADDGIVTRSGRAGFYAHFFRHGQEVQQKLGDTIEEARERMKELKTRLDAEAGPDRRGGARPHPPKIVKPLHDQLRDLARDLLKLHRAVKALEAGRGADRTTTAGGAS